MRPKVAIIITGPFEDHELASFIGLMRYIDGQHPERHYTCIINDPDASLGEAEHALRDMMPERPDRKTEFTVLRKE